MKCRRSSAIAGIKLFLAAMSFWAAADMASASWTNLASAPLVSPSAAWSYYGSGTTRTIGAAAWTTDIPEIATLSRTLGASRVSSAQYTQNVFDYVRNNIEVEFRFGLSKGGRGAVIDQSGTPFDQADLMVKLLRQGGVSASYQLGTITLAYEQFGLWTGLVTSLNQANQSFTVDARQACQLLADGGIPALVNGSSDCSQVSGNLTSVTMGHVWVMVNGTAYDPSFKTHLLKTGIDVSAAMGCGTAAAPSCGNAIVTAGMTGAYQNGQGIQLYNMTALQNQLSTLAVNLQHWIQNTDRLASLQDIVGGAQLVVAPAPYTYSSSAVGSPWSGDNGVPDQYRTRLGVNGATYFADELAGRRLQYGNDYGLIDNIVVSPPSGGAGTVALPAGWGAGQDTCESRCMIIDVDHPYAANGGAYADDHSVLKMFGEMDPGVPNQLNGGARDPVTIIHGWGNTSQATDQQIAGYQEANHTKTSDGGIDLAASVGTTSLVNIGYGNYMNDNQAVLIGKLLGQGSAADRVITGLGHAQVTRHHDVGIAFARSRNPSDSSYISVISKLSVNTNTSDLALRCPVFEVEAFTWTLLEGAVNSQVENTLIGLTALGSHSDVSQTCAAGATSSNYIYAGAGGGGQVNTDPLHLALDTVKNEDKGNARKKYLSVSPADGAATITVTDLVTGSGKFPESLPFQRIYRTDAGVTESTYQTTTDVTTALDDGTYDTQPTQTFTNWKYSGPDSTANSHLGGGWTHNYNIIASYSANNYKAFGSDTALDASTAIATLWAAMDASRTNALANLLTYQYAANWLATKLAFTSVVVDKGGQSEAFQRLPDGNFTSLSNSAHLVQSGEPQPGFPHAQDFAPVTFLYTGKDGDTISFDWAKQSLRWYANSSFCNGTCTIHVADPVFKATHWNFPDGTALTFNYEGHWLVSSSDTNQSCMQYVPYSFCSYPAPPGQPYGYVLKSVTNNLGRSLTFDTVEARMRVHAPDQTSLTDETSSYRISGVTDDQGRHVSYALSDCPDVAVPSDLTPVLTATARFACGTFTATGPDNAVTKYTYNPQSAGGQVSSYRLNAWYTPSDPSFPYQRISYDSLMRISAITDKLGHVTSYFPGGVAKNEIWKRADTVDPLGNTSTAIFDRWNSLISETDPLQRTKTFAYDNARRKILETLPEGNSTSYTYDVRSNVLTTTQHAKPNSGLADIVNSTTYMEDPAVSDCVNQLTCNKPHYDTNARGYNTYYGWKDNTGLLASVLSGMNADGSCPYPGGACPRVDIDYDLQGNVFKPSYVEKVIDAAHKVKTTYSYDPGNHYVLSTATVDPTGLHLVTSLTFDLTGNLTQVDGPRDHADVDDVTDYTWDANRRLLYSIGAATTDNGTSHPRIAALNTYDADGLLRAVQKGTTTTATGSDFSASVTTRLVYDPVGNKVQETTPTSVTQYSYDADDRVLCTATRMNAAVFGPLPAVSVISSLPRTPDETLPNACALGSTAANDDQDRITRNTYDPAGQLTQIERAYLSTAAQIYARYLYTLNGKQQAVADGVASSLAPVLCANGVSQGAPPSHQTNYCYDGFDRLTATAFPDNTVEQITEYDAGNNPRTRVTRAGQIISFTYDSLDRVHQKSVPGVSDIVAANTVTWTYDQLSQITNISDSLGNSLDSTFDAASRLRSVTNTVPALGGGTGLTSKTIGYDVDNAGNRTRITWPEGGYFVTYSFDALNRMEEAKENGTTSIAKFQYESLGRPDWRAYMAANDKVSYLWTTEGDLTSLTQGLNGNANYVAATNGYNPAHQIISSSLTRADFAYVPTSNPSVRYEINGLNQYTSVGGQNLSWSTNGNLISNSSATYDYDPENRLMKASLPSASETVLYAYDPLGRRTAKAVSGPNYPGTTYFLSSGDDEIAEYDGSGNLLRRYVPGPGIDQPIAMVTAAGVKSFFHQDKLGSVVAMSDSAGNIANNGVGPEGPYTYDAYGNCLINGQPCAGGIPYKYTGRRYDPETGLYYYRARYYWAKIGRFLQTDPVGYKDDLNWYSYVGNDPTDATDPTGNETNQQSIVNGSIRNTCGGAVFCQVTYYGPQEGQTPGTNGTQVAQTGFSPSPDRLRRAQDDARNNMSFAPGKGGTHCNQAARAICDALGIPTGDIGGNANQMARELANSPNWRPTSPENGQALANVGYAVMGAQYNPRGHGHVALIRSQNIAGDQPPAHGRGPLINQIGSTVGVKNENYAFSKGLPIQYYVFVP